MHETSPPEGTALRRRVGLSTALAAILALAVAGMLAERTPAPGPAAPARQAALAAPPEPAREAQTEAEAAPEALAASSALLDSVAITRFAPPTPALDALAPEPAPEPDTAQDVAQDSPQAPETQAEGAPRMVPLPVPRPQELRPQEQRRRADPARAAARRSRQAAAAPAPMEDTRTFFEKLLGVGQPAPAPQGPALAYAALETPPAAAGAASPRRLLTPAPPAVGAPAGPDPSGGIAVYDISARTVTLPSGEVLEAHSGLGETMDDPRYVHMRMRGSTPPGTYDLTEREALFHGVRAIRLTPVGGPEAIHGRAGLLAHTYMLGPNGASNGCISFRNYDRFLQAFLRGEVARVVVVPGRKLDSLPSFAEKLFGKPVQSARAE